MMIGVTCRVSLRRNSNCNTCKLAICHFGRSNQRRGFPPTRVYPYRTELLGTLQEALDDPKRAVRAEAVRTFRVWSSMMG
eukprot:2516355-Pyramimonas_sp.AAC.1